MESIDVTERIPVNDESFDLIWFYLFFEDLWDLQEVESEEVSVVVRETHRILRPHKFVFTRYPFPHEYIPNGFKMLTEKNAIDKVYQKLEVAK